MQRAVPRLDLRPRLRGLLGRRGLRRAASRPRRAHERCSAPCRVWTSGRACAASSEDGDQGALHREQGELMRPIKLDLDGFTVFREPTTVDFTDLDFFALVGPTGAGKSTILDAITFALYGTVPRWADRRAIANALAPSAAEARVR